MVETEMDDNVSRNYVKFRMKKKSRKKRFERRCKEKSSAPEINLHAETHEYLVRMVDVIDKVRNDAYEMEVLAGNVISEIKGTEVHFAKIRVTSKLLEDLLPYAGDNDFNQFITPFITNLRPVFTDKVTSHILQAIAEELLRRYVKNMEVDEKSSVSYRDTLLKISVFALNNIETFIWDSSSNYVLRTIINVLIGSNSKGEVMKEVEKNKLPPEFDETLEKFAHAFINSPQFNELFCKAHTSGLIQSLLYATKHLESTNKTLVKKIIKHCKSNPPDLKDGRNEPILRLIEAGVEVANEKQFKKIYERLFRNNLKDLSILKNTNFAVQKLIRNCKNKEQFEMIFNELSPFGESILEARNTGVLLELVQGCVKHRSNQGDCIKMMMRILKCKKTMNEDSDLAALTCSMVTSDNYNPEKMRINLHGTIILQAFLNFGKPVKVVNGLLNMDTPSLLQLICDVKGCHIVDAYMESTSVGEKSREKLFRKLSGHFTKLATSKYGSRALDAIWNASTTKYRVLLMQELKQNESELNSTTFGKIFSHKRHLSVFRRDQEEWIKCETTLETTKRCFANIIPAKKGKFDD